MLIFYNKGFWLLIVTAKLAIFEQTILFEFLYFYENDCGNVPNIRKRLQYVLCGVSYCVVGIILNCCTKLLLFIEISVTP